jgi:hypothetical protein
VTIGQSLGFGAAAALSPLAVGVLGVVIERLLFRRFYKADPALSLLLTFGLAMIAEQALRMVFGAPPLSWSIPEALRGQVFLGDFVYPRYRLLILAVALACVAGLWLLLEDPTIDVRWQHNHSHFWLVLVVSLVNVALGLRIQAAAAARRDARLFLVSLAFLACAGFFAVDGIDSAKLGAWLMDKYRIVTTPIVHPEFQGIRITPNFYTTIDEVDLFAEKVLEAVRKGIA